MQHYVTKFVNDLQRVVGFLRVHTPVFSTNKADYHGVTHILLKVALSTITLCTLYVSI